jgi:hypothetical protein
VTGVALGSTTRTRHAPAPPRRFVPLLGTGSTALAIPASPSLAGTIVLSQSAVFVPGINPFGFITSNGVRLVLDVQ